MSLTITNQNFLCHIVLQPCTNILRNTDDFEWILESGISNAEKIADVELTTLEHLSKRYGILRSLFA